MTAPYSKFYVYSKVWFDENKRKMYPSNDEKKIGGHLHYVAKSWPLNVNGQLLTRKKLATKRTAPVIVA